MKEFIDLLKKLWKNARTRSLVILILYLFFFIFVFTVLSSLNTNTQNKEEQDEFYYLNNIEIINYNAYDIYNNVILEYNQTLVDGKVIYKLVKNSVLASTDYIENVNTYHISIKDYEKLINNTSVDVDGIIKIIISSNNITLDFTDYYGYKINIDIRS